MESVVQIHRPAPICLCIDGQATGKRGLDHEPKPWSDVDKGNSFKAVCEKSVRTRDKGLSFPAHHREIKTVRLGKCAEGL